MSKTVRKYLQKLGVKKYSVSKKTVENYKTRPNLFEAAVFPMRELLGGRISPHKIGFYFVRDSKRKFDIINAMQIVQDLLVAHDVIEDDDASCLIPYPLQIDGLWYHVDKNNPGCFLEF